MRWLLLALLVSGLARAEKAVLESSLEKGMRLSERARARLGIKVEEWKGGALPASALVRYQSHRGVYRQRNGWLKLVEPGEIRRGDDIVVVGAPLLRVAQMDLEDEGSRD